ncbi:MAG: PIN domain-containing protein [Gemmatimonadetes bacterium]|nr:PIN domain-containing protein [Gemmatimonadota bacterium]
MTPGPRDVLLDTGPLVALLDPRDEWHQRVLPEWPRVIQRCVTTEAVVTEASHLSGRGAGSPVRSLEYVLSANIPIVALPASALRHAVSLMHRYADLPMDFADATLVAVGDALGLSAVFTTDRRGFGAYRGARGLAFELLPA